MVRVVNIAHISSNAHHVTFTGSCVVLSLLPDRTSHGADQWHSLNIGLSKIYSFFPGVT